MNHAISMLESPIALDGAAHGRAIMACDLPFMGFGAGTKPNPLPANITDSDWDWFVANGPLLTLNIVGITMLANGTPAVAEQSALLKVLLDQNRRYYRMCGNTYPVATQPADQYLLRPLATIDYSPGLVRETYTPMNVMLSANDAIIVDMGGVGGGTIQLAWSLCYDR